MRRRLLALLVGCLLVAPAASATPFTLSLDPTLSLLTVSDLSTGTPLLGPVELSGTITIDVDALIARGRAEPGRVTGTMATDDMCAPDRHL